MYLNEGVKKVVKSAQEAGVVFLDKHHGLRAGHEAEADGSLNELFKSIANAKYL